ncbi:hypothetical protein CAEBREN_14970 [Caenorhabditis brenneri]|uniref:C2H2-type domain-containing protein n=1 Tax=Caenorhabditis brenneri TaxID=135651 RepID=G0N0G2_CAEBE|nr:hypothetical protein CAEBREN_14970 [Caenorhabditis brenneri]
METLLTVKLGVELKNEHPLAVILCRGAGICDLDFRQKSVLDHWKNVKICEHHANELLKGWNSMSPFRDSHLYRGRSSSFEKFDACSIPNHVGPKHKGLDRRPPGRSYLSVKGSDAILKQEHLLVHPGIPLCKAHEKYVTDLIAALHGPSNKKQKTSTISEDSESTCSISDDESYKTPIARSSRTELAKHFSLFASTAGENRVCTKSPWRELQPKTQEKKARSAKNLFYTMLGIMVPNGVQEFKEMVEKKTFMKAEWTTDSSDGFKSLMNQIASQFFAAENRRSKLIVLSLAANSVSYLDVVKYIPNLSRHMYQSAKVYGRRQKIEDTEKDKKLQRYNPEAIQAFIGFITSPTVMIGLPHGVRNVKKSDGSRMEIPDSIRQQSATEVIQMWINVCKENGDDHLLLSPSIMYKILDVCSAKKRESSTCVDYFIAYGSEAFDELHRIVGEWKAEQLFEDELLKTLDTELFEAAQYLRTDFRLHIKSHSRVADHCAQFALSDPTNKKLSSSCSEIPNKHTHDYKCGRCEKVSETFEKMEEYAEELVAVSEKLLISGRATTKNDEEVLNRRKDELQKIKKGITQIADMKKHLLRAAYTNQEREGIIAGLRDNEALITLDFAQKFLPKFHRERQNQYFGKKGISYHISHTHAKIGNAFAQHSFVHIYSGSVIQDSSLVVLTIAHFASELAKVGIKKIFLRSDNAGAYHSAATIGSLHWLNETTGVEIGSWSFSEAQNGKSSSDRDANRVKRKAKNYVDQGNDIPTSEEFFNALKENPLNGVSVYHGTVTPSSDSGKTEFEGVSSLNYFTLEKGGLRARRYGSIGEGILIAKSAMKPIKGKFKFDDKAGFLASNIVSKEKERDAVLSGTETKFWYFSPCTKTTQCVKEPDVVSDNVEEEAREGNSDALFACPVPGCSAVFLKHYNLENHTLRGKHVISPERMTGIDYALNLFARYLEDVNESRTYPKFQEALGELTVGEDEVTVQQGWGLQEKKKRKPFPEDAKAFLIECFNEGVTTGKPLSPFAVEKRMRNAKNAQGGRRFSEEEILSVPQISGFLFREAQKRRSAQKNSQATASQCRKKPSNLQNRRRRSGDCKEEEPREIAEEVHQDSEWIDYTKSEEFWTLADELYQIVIENLDKIYTTDSRQI